MISSSCKPQRQRWNHQRSRRLRSRQPRSEVLRRISKGRKSLTRWWWSSKSGSYHPRNVRTENSVKKLSASYEDLQVGQKNSSWCCVKQSECRTRFFCFFRLDGATVNFNTWWGNMVVLSGPQFWDATCFLQNELSKMISVWGFEIL